MNQIQPQEQRAKARAAFVRDLWQECLDDCAGDESQAKMLFEKITDSVAKQELQRQTRLRKRARTGSNIENVDIESTSQAKDDAESNSDSDEPIARLAVRRSRNSSSHHCVQRESNADEDSQLSTELAGRKVHAEVLEGEQNKFKLNARHRLRKATVSLRWLKPGEVSQRVGISQSVLRNWAKAGVVMTMLSPGGHRLYNLKTVEQHIRSAGAVPKQQMLQQEAGPGVPENSDSDSESSSLRDGERQIVVYARLDGTKLTDQQLQATSNCIRTKVETHYQHSCSESELQSCLIIVELEPNDNSKRSQQNGHDFANTPGSRRLLQTICKRGSNGPARGRRSMVVLQAADDISSVPSTYAFFTLLCRNMGATIEIVPGLFEHWQNSVL